MQRISSNMKHMDMNYHLRRREWQRSELDNKIASQSKINNLRDDPLAAARSVRLQSGITRLERFGKNIDSVRGNHSIAEGYMVEANDILQRIRELGIQGANGIYDKQQMGYMGEEVDQLLKELVLIGNARGGDGTTLFSGFNTNRDPFKLTNGPVDGATGQRIVGVDYMGNIGQNRAEISEGAFAETNFPGNKVFWAENQQIYSTQDATNYRVQQNSTIRIDGQDIELKAGDNVYAIMSKINASDTAVRAKLDPVRNSLVLETTTPHQIWAEDTGPENVLRDLGILSPDPGSQPPLNINSTATVFGGSLFDMVINLRDSLFRGDPLEVGGGSIGGIDDAMENLRINLAELGAKDERLQMTAKRIDYETPEMIAMNSAEVDLDLSEAVTELKMLEFAHKAALSATSRILQPSLLDFIR